jgi:hypothetical protein
MGDVPGAQHGRGLVEDNAMNKFDFDVFISHASEDKATFVTPLANALKKYGLKVWFDKFTLKVGDSLHRSIEKGLARSRYGVVVFSPKFLAKNWPMAELDGLFAREMDGHKVILPVWHKMNSARLKKVLPMQADKYAPRSSEGVEEVARKLVEVIRPELLELDVRKESAFEAGESFIAEARRKYPGYDFAVQSGPITGSNSLETEFSVAKGTRRIEIRVSDPSIMTSPPGGRLQFFGEGVKKAIEFQRTGKSQKWEPSEFALKDFNVPLMPSNVEGGTMSIGKLLPNISPRSIRVEVGSPTVAVFSIMELRPVRLGSHESELIISDNESPLKISIVSPIGTSGVYDSTREVDLTLSWEEISGKKVSECKKLIEAIDALRLSSQLRLIDIRLDQLIFETTVRLLDNDDPFGPNFRRATLLASQIEETFSVSLRMHEIISEEDTNSLFHFDCLLNGREYGKMANNTLRLIKAEGEVGAAQEYFVKGEWPATFTDAPSDYTGYFLLFSRRVATRDWVRVVEFIPADVSTALKVFSEAPIGSEFNVEITAKAPAHLCWRDDSVLKNIKVGKLAQ